MNLWKDHYRSASRPVSVHRFMLVRACLVRAGVRRALPERGMSGDQSRALSPLAPRITFLNTLSFFVITTPSGIPPAELDVLIINVG